MNAPKGRRTSRPAHTKLHALLIKACPPAKDGPGSIKSTLAPKVGVSYQFIYRWIERNKIPPKYVSVLVEAAEGRVTQEDLIPFVI